MLTYWLMCVCVCVCLCVCVCMYHLPIVSLRSALHIELYSLHCSLISERILLSLEVPKLLPLVPLIRLRWVWNVGVILKGENQRTGTKSGPRAALSITNATGLALDRTQAFTVRGLRLAVWSIARPVYPFRYISNILKSGYYLQGNTPHLDCLNMFRKTVAVENQTSLRVMLKQVVEELLFCEGRNAIELECWVQSLPVWLLWDTVGWVWSYKLQTGKWRSRARCN